MARVAAHVAERRYERWVMRAAELAHGDYPSDREEAERIILLRMREDLPGGLPPADSREQSMQDLRPLVSSLYSAAGGDEWALEVDLDIGAPPSARVRGVSLEPPYRRADISVGVRSLACESADALRALYERIAAQLPRREITAEEAANEALEAIEQMQGVLERVREISAVLDTHEEMQQVRVALDNLWMVLAGIAAAEEDRSSAVETNHPCAPEAG